MKFINATKVQSARKAIVSREVLEGMSDIFKILGDPTRLKVVLALSRAELCVQDIAGLLSMSESSISHQLRLLKAQRLVKHRRDGKLIYYSLDDKHIKDIIRTAKVHSSE